MAILVAEHGDAASTFSRQIANSHASKADGQLDLMGRSIHAHSAKSQVLQRRPGKGASAIAPWFDCYSIRHQIVRPNLIVCRSGITLSRTAFVVSAAQVHQIGQHGRLHDSTTQGSDSMPERRKIAWNSLGWDRPTDEINANCCDGIISSSCFLLQLK